MNSSTARSLRERRTVDYTSKANHSELPDWLKSTSYAYITESAQKQKPAGNCVQTNKPAKRTSNTNDTVNKAKRQKTGVVAHMAPQSLSATPAGAPAQKRKASSATIQGGSASRKLLLEAAALAQDQLPAAKRHRKNPVLAGHKPTELATHKGQQIAKRQQEQKKTRPSRKLGMRTRQTAAKHVEQGAGHAIHDLRQSVTQLMQASRTSSSDLNQMKKDFNELRKSFNDFKSIYFRQHDQVTKDMQKLHTKSSKR